MHITIREGVEGIFKTLYWYFESVVDGLKTTESVRLKLAVSLFILGLAGIVLQIQALTQLVAILGPFVLIIAEAFSRGHSKKLRKNRRHKDVRKILSELKKNISDKTAQDNYKITLETSDKVVDDIATTKSIEEPFIYKYVFRNKLLSVEGYSEENLLILLLCDLIDNSSESKEIKNAKETIKIIYSEELELDEEFSKLGAEEKEFLCNYKRRRDGNKLKPEFSFIKDSRKVYEDFLNTYLPQNFANTKLNLLKTQENIDVKEIITKIFREDELYLKNVREDMRKRLEDEIAKLEDELAESSGYLVFSKMLFGKNYDKEVLEERFPDNWYVGKWDKLPLSCHVIYPSMTYEDSEDILENEIMPLVRKKEVLREDSQVFVVSLETRDYDSYPEETISEYPEHFEDNLDKIQFLSRGYSNKMDLVIDSMVGIKISTRELLASLPINAFVDDELGEEKRIFLSNIYSELTEEDNLNIDELFDWAQREPGRIERKLKDLNDETLNETEIKEVTEKIVEKSVALDRAIGKT